MSIEKVLYRARSAAPRNWDIKISSICQALSARSTPKDAYGHGK
jgi:hypothetical protein